MFLFLFAVVSRYRQKMTSFDAILNTVDLLSIITLNWSKPHARLKYFFFKTFFPHFLIEKYDSKYCCNCQKGVKIVNHILYNFHEIVDYQLLKIFSIKLHQFSVHKVYLYLKENVSIYINNSVSSLPIVYMRISNWIQTLG